MEQLKKKLSASLTANPDVMILKSDAWQLPVSVNEVSYGRLKRLKMDILMKMLLFAFQETDIRRAAALADMLAVEELFISDLIHKMKSTGLIALGKKGYVLTSKGFDYLEKGIFEEELDDGQAIIAFSESHGDYRLAEMDGQSEAADLPLFRYAADGEPDSDRMYELLSREMDAAEENFQLIVSGIKEVTEKEAIHIPCIEFQLYDRKQDLFFSRVWNTGSKLWDEALEKAIEERELIEWRKAVENEETEKTSVLQNG
ncbi:hypothetical protein [Planococcus sp. CAU13]|uniref:hypothetical protein n=1 Tax=Planococcus sp. CAU13 TaxID=1541197 RepID=UPI00068FC76C|nr:hypothetical protein [Planococcus sp. CAU13]